MGTVSGKRQVCLDKAGSGRGVVQVENAASRPPFPDTAMLRRCWAWMAPVDAMQRPGLERVAHHEAGHVVLLEWLGLESPGATATDTNGRCMLPPLPDDLPGPPTDESGEVRATAAAMFHSGVVAELLFLGVQWTGPVFYPRQQDYQMADELLAPKFGRHASGAHAFAQRVALHVLSGRWGRVREVAAHLARAGRWEAGANHATGERQAAAERATIKSA